MNQHRTFELADDDGTIVGHARELLRFIGLDVEHEDLAATPLRMVKALVEMTAGLHESPKEILSKRFDAGRFDEMVVLRGIEFTSLCEHHILPFRGTATVGYIPSEKVVGLSKLARVTLCFARRPQMQERMTRQIADAIEEHLQPKGVGVLVEAHHQCMGCRGVHQPAARMVTSALLGAMRQPETRAEFLGLAR